MTAIGSTPPTATRAEPADILIGNFTVNGPITTDITVEALRRSNADYDIESINNNVRLITGGVVGVELAANGDFHIDTNGIFYDKSTGFTGIGVGTPQKKLDVLGRNFRVQENGNECSFRTESLQSISDGVEWDSTISSNLCFGFFQATRSSGLNSDVVFFNCLAGVLSILQAGLGFVELSSTPASNRYGLFISGNTIRAKGNFGFDVDFMITTFSSNS